MGTDLYHGARGQILRLWIIRTDVRTYTDYTGLSTDDLSVTACDESPPLIGKETHRRQLTEDTAEWNLARITYIFQIKILITQLFPFWKWLLFHTIFARHGVKRAAVGEATSVQKSVAVRRHK